MSIKNELILSYIKELDVGTKISVRRLSEILDVSVGTVYKGIKAAEAQGLGAAIDHFQSPNPERSRSIPASPVRQSLSA